ncbi:histone H2B-like [Narcine bancroftii]|uniref:histone H2B-like n=1 Tax=Narcine bancroftii TaxID=1343680 RepID=UPI0038310409
MRFAVKYQQLRGVVRAKKRMSFKRKSRYSSYIFRVLKQVHPEHGSVGIVRMNSLEQIATEAARLSLCSKRRTITSQEIGNALHHLPPGQ